MSQENKSILDEYISEKDLISKLPISKTTLWRLRRKGLIKAYKIEGLRKNYFSVNEVFQFKEANL